MHISFNFGWYSIQFDIFHYENGVGISLNRQMESANRDKNYLLMVPYLTRVGIITSHIAYCKVFKVNINF